MVYTVETAPVSGPSRYNCDINLLHSILRGLAEHSNCFSVTVRSAVRPVAQVGQHGTEKRSTEAA